jgi:hypothetical protein
MKYLIPKSVTCCLNQAQETIGIPIRADKSYWQGATPDGEFTHIAINTNSQKGIVQWLQRVTDEEYNSFQ